MAFPTSTTDIIATSIESRRKEIRDNVTYNNALFAQLKEDDRVVEITGGSTILEELSFAPNANAQFYSGYDLLSVSPQDVISAAQFTLKQASCAVVISGLEMIQNSGPEALLDLLDARTGVAEASMANLLTQGAYSDGTIFGGKAIVGLGAAVVANPATGVYGGIDPSLWTFWRNQTGGPGGGSSTSANIQANMNTLYASCVRGKDAPNLIIFDNNLFAAYEGSLQTLQRFMSPTGIAKLGFQTYAYKGATVVLDGGIGGYDPAWTGYFLNTKYLKYRPHKDRNIVTLNPQRRYAINQDAEATIIAWAGALTCAGRQFQGYFAG